MKQLLAVILAASQCWGALNFANATTDKVNCGSASTIDDISVGTILIWFKPNSTANSERYLLSKIVNPGYINLYQPAGDGTKVRLDIDRATTDLLARSAAGTLTVGVETFFAVTYDATSATAPVTYKGTRSVVAAANCDPGGCSAGSGSFNSEAAADLKLGNIGTVDTKSLDGAISFVGWWNRIMPVEEIISQQFRPRRTTGNVFFTHLYTTANFADLSGNAHACVVTGATVVNHVPIGPWFGFNIRKFLGIDYENHTSRTIFAD